jgi:iron complex transport system substrate-binding protein
VTGPPILSGSRPRLWDYWGVRIVSLVPSSTEMLFALGLGEQTVGVTHECDFPPAAATLPRLTATVMPEGLSAGEIDAAVKQIVGEGRALYSLDEERLAELAPDLIVTQAVCDVCAVSYEDVVAVAKRLPGRPEVVQQDPSSLGEVLADLDRLGAAAGIEERARELRGDWKSGWPPSAPRCAEHRSRAW